MFSDTGNLMVRNICQQMYVSNLSMSSVYEMYHHLN